MLRTLTVALGLAVAASAVAAEEFVVITNDLFTEAGAAVAPSSPAELESNVVSASELPENVQAAIANARGEAPTYFDVNPFN
jgi:hypothetical protein